ncbi:MAG: OB-fold domain-containing protein [Candidatus Helarchaeota archaeon]|nr:OB-fold domain-containing protein [Candidatus Helarchaeota archaeon]
MSTPPLFRETPINLKLEGKQCENCGYVSYPEYHKICVKCGTVDQWKVVKLAKKGTVMTYIIQHYLPAMFETPLPLAIIDLDPPGGRVYGMLTETKAEEMKVGLRVEVNFREIYYDRGLGIHSIKFKPIRE